MSRILNVITVPTAGAYYNEDLAALQKTPIPVANRYTAPATSPGFSVIRQPAEALSVGLVLDSGEVAWGDCVAVAYGGLAGRDPVFSAAAAEPIIHEVVTPWLVGLEVDRFRPLGEALEALRQTVTYSRPVPPEPEEPVVKKTMSRRELLTAPARFFRSVQTEVENAKNPQMEEVTDHLPLHSAIRYGVSQALLAAVALSQRLTAAEVISNEWGLPTPDQMIPIHAQSGSDRYRAVDKMIVRRVASLPHGLVDDIPAQIGEEGNDLVRYVRWLSARIQQLGGPDYKPTIHLDMHGALGTVTGNQYGKMLGHLYALELAARPFHLRIESPLIMESRDEQVTAIKRLRDHTRTRRLPVSLVVDEWANTLEDIQAFIAGRAAEMIQVKLPSLGSVHNGVDAILACKAGKFGVLLGGSCAETHLSAKISVQIALATRPDLILAKPGMGVDEAVTWVSNEMQRSLAEIRALRHSSSEDSSQDNPAA